MSDIGNPGEVITDGFGVEFTVSSDAPDVTFSLANAGDITSNLDGLLVHASPANLVATGQFTVDNTGAINSTSGRAIHFDLTIGAPGSLTITNGVGGVLTGALGAILIERDAAATINNAGTINGSVTTTGGADIFNLFTGSSISGLLDSGAGNDTVNLQGSGSGTLNSFANVESINLIGGDWTLGSENVTSVNFQAGQQTLGLSAGVLANGSFSGTIDGFEIGDVINLEGVGQATSATLGAGNVLTVAGLAGGPVTLQLDPAQDFAGHVFQVMSDGAGGTNVNLSSLTTISNAGTINSVGDGILITINAVDPGQSATVTNAASASITGGLNGVHVISDPTTLTATGTFLVDNAGLIRSSGTGSAINFDLSVASPGSITINNQVTGTLQTSGVNAISIAGSSADTINNAGTITGGVSTGGGDDTFNLVTGSSISGTLDAGTGSDTVNLSGLGSGSLNSFTNVEVVNLVSGDWTLGSEGTGAVVFQSGLQTLGLSASVLADGAFAPTINSFDLGDTINLEGIGLATTASLGANNVLTVTGGTGGPIELQLDPTQDFSGQTFQISSDGAGGTNLLLASSSDIGNSGTIEGIDYGILIEVSASDPGADWTVTNSGTVRGGIDGVRIQTIPANLTATGDYLVENTGLIESTGSGSAINFALEVGAPGGIEVINHSTGTLRTTSGTNAIVSSGNSADTITNAGTIVGGVSTGGGADTFNLVTGSSISGTLNSGSGIDTVNLSGSGQGSLNSFTGVEVINLAAGDWTLGSENVTSVNFQAGSQTLGLSNGVLANGSFTGTISGFALGDTIDLNGIGLATTATLGANNVLTVSGGSSGPITLQLDPTQSFSNVIFQLTSNGAGGTNVELATVNNGGNGNDTVTGTVGNDIVSSGNGNDTINSGDGNDRIAAGNGNDTINTGNGNSTIGADNGDDTINAGNGNNAIATGNGNDRVTVGNGSNNIVGDNGNDIVTAGNGNNTISGDNGNDTITLGNGNNIVSGGNGNDVITAGNGNNNLSGGNGNDTFHLGSGDNILSGGNGNDTFVFGPDLGENTITDFGGNDRIEFIDVFATFQELQAAVQQVGGNAVIVLDADSSVTLVGVTASSLHSSDFLLS